jgi:hypothetical protein
MLLQRAGSLASLTTGECFLLFLKLSSYIVFRNVTKAAIDGVNGTQQSFNTLKEAWEVYDMCRELGLLEVL